MITKGQPIDLFISDIMMFHSNGRASDITSGRYSLVATLESADSLNEGVQKV